MHKTHKKQWIKKMFFFCDRDQDISNITKKSTIKLNTIFEYLIFFLS